MDMLVPRRVRWFFQQSIMATIPIPTISAINRWSFEALKKAESLLLMSFVTLPVPDLEVGVNSKMAKWQILEPPKLDIPSNWILNETIYSKYIYSFEYLLPLLQSQSGTCIFWVAVGSPNFRLQFIEFFVT